MKKFSAHSDRSKSPVSLGFDAKPSSSAAVKSNQPKYWPPQIGFLVLMWIITGIALVLPVVGLTNQQKILMLVPAVLFSFLLILLDSVNGYTFWVLIITFLVTQTGFQADIGSIRTSALELILVILLMLFVIFRNNDHYLTMLSIPGQKFIIAFLVYSIVVFAIGLIRGDSFSLGLIEFKGFILYPFMSLIMLAGIRDKRMLSILSIFMVISYSWVAGNGLFQSFQGNLDYSAGVVFRADGAYSAINLFGITLMSMALFVLGLTGEMTNKPVRWGGLFLSAWLILGAASSVARTVWIVLALGLMFLALFGRANKGYIFVIAISALLYFWISSTSVTNRILQLGDSSTIKREFYLLSGLHAFAKNWLMGNGWGNGWWYYDGIGFVRSGYIPWYHNDYLNLAVQTGIIGLILYLVFWGKFILRGINRFKAAGSAYSPYILGSLAGLVGLLVAAGFDHVLWRPDMAGLVGWMAGMLIAAINLSEKSNTDG